jgi:hypothetical protein
MSKITVFAAAFALATVAFWSVVLTSPPTSQASVATASNQAEMTDANHCAMFSLCP